MPNYTSINVTTYFILTLVAIVSVVLLSTPIVITPQQKKLQRNLARMTDLRLETDYREVTPDLCPEQPPDLIGNINLDYLTGNLSDNKIFQDKLIEVRQTLQPGGRYVPPGCTSRHRVLIVIPYRDRKLHLEKLLSHIHPILQRQQLNYQIVVAEQYGRAFFNKGVIMNAAVKEAKENFNFSCIVFHDVDLLPENDRNMYSCPEHPRHLSRAIDKLHYKLPYHRLIGGVLAIRKEHFEKVNGYSNVYWGWGAEDDDLESRIRAVGLKITRPKKDIGRYKMLAHPKRGKSPLRTKLLNSSIERFENDGLNSVDYTLLCSKRLMLYTHFLIDVGIPPADLIQIPKKQN